jgi:hypothetical protein
MVMIRYVIRSSPEQDFILLQQCCFLRLPAIWRGIGKTDPDYKQNSSIKTFAHSLDYSQLRTIPNRVNSRLKTHWFASLIGALGLARRVTAGYTFFGDSRYGQEVQDRVVTW